MGVLAAPVSVAVGAPSVALPSVPPASGVSFAATEWIISVWSPGAAVAATAAGSVPASAAPVLAVVVLGRLLGGFGAGGTDICIYACIHQTLDRRGRVSALAAVAVCQAAASGSGSLIGGLLTANLVGGLRWPCRRWRC